MVETLLHVSDSLVAGDEAASTDENGVDGVANVVRRATRRSVDAVVHSGNLFHDAEPDPDVVDAVQTELEVLDDAGIPLFTVVGSRESGGESDARRDVWRSDAVQTLSEQPTTLGEVTLFGIDHVDSETALLERLRALEPADGFSYNVVCVDQRIWPPLPKSDADVSAFDVLEATDVFVDEVLAGGCESRRVWESDDFDYRVTYSGPADPARGDAGEPAVATLVRAATDEHSHERVPLGDTGVGSELEHLQTVLEYQPADVEDADVETLADLYGLAARAKRVFEDRRTDLRDELLDRVDDDRRIQGEYATVNRTTQRRRTAKPEPDVLETVQRAGIDRDEVLALDTSTLRDVCEEGRVEEEAVFDVERRSYVRVSDTFL